MSNYFEGYRGLLKQLSDALSAYQSPLVDIAKQFQLSQSMIRSIPPIEFPRILPYKSILPNSIVKELGEMIRAVNESQMRQFAKDLERILSSSQLFSQQILENQAVFNRVHANLINDLVSATSQLNETSKLLATTFDSIRLSELTAFSSLSVSPVLAQLSFNLSQAILTPDLTNFSGGLLGDISSLLWNIAESEPAQFDGKVVSGFEERFADYVRDVKPGRITYEGIAQIIRDLVLLLSLILTWVSLQSDYDSGQTLEETQQVIRNIDNQVNEQSQHLHTLGQNTDGLEAHLETLDKEAVISNQHLQTLVELGGRLMLYAKQVDDSTEEAVILVTKNITLLRSEPSRNGSVITHIYPNQLVKQLKQEKGWIYVEFFDYTEAVPKTGWVYRKNLVLLRD